MSIYQSTFTFDSEGLKEIALLTRHMHTKSATMTSGSKR